MLKNFLVFIHFKDGSLDVKKCFQCKNYKVASNVEYLISWDVFTAFMGLNFRNLRSHRSNGLTTK